ncbi:aminotransferase [Terrihabitans sp. B22-R8]|uniref:aminotransferase n=1 Tax=Terrihabitans sp. B22-R8 TaxID=3425128 RepID=UPI00403D4BB6
MRRGDTRGSDPPRKDIALNPLYQAMRTTIFEEMSQLARAHGAINLGQGFPDGAGPLDLRQDAARAVLDGSNQYPPSMGLPELRAAVAHHYRAHQGLDVEDRDVLVTSGATEAIAAALLAVLSPGDEVILLEPMYDAYLPLVQRAGAQARFVTLHPPEWRLPIADIAAAIGPRTRAIVLNDPMNPAARVFERAELEALAALCAAHDLVAICDEVWEHVLFDGRPHHSLLGLPGMAERAVKIGSAGKIFALTGWKVGFVLAGPRLLGPIARAHQFLTFTTPPNLQSAVAFGLGKERAFFTQMRADLQRSRDRLTGALTGAGFAVLPSEATYFLCVDLAASGIVGRDGDVCRAWVEEAGVAAIPVSAFYASGNGTTNVVRLCFAKAAAVLDEAAERLGRWRTRHVT